MMSDDEDYYIYHSAASKTTVEVMEYYLEKLHSTFASGKPCALILDQYPSHISDETKAATQKYNIKLVYIPVSATDKYHPLDRYIFGIIKSQATSKFYDKAFEQIDGFTKPEAADLFVQPWNELKQLHIVV